MKQPIELRRQRDFGQTINDSFTFFRDNFKPLIRALLIICGFFIVISTISTVFTYLGMSNFYGLATFQNPDNMRAGTVSYVVNLMVNAFIVILTQAFIHLATLCYISVYLQKNNITPAFGEVWGYFKYYFWRAVGGGFVIFILFAVGFMLCLIPGIWLMPVLSLTVPIIVIENSSFSYAFNKSFSLIKNNWWLVFGVIFIMSLIIGVASSIVGIPITIITLGRKFLSLRSIKIPLIVIFSILRNILLLAYALPSIAVCMCYFNLTEEKEGTGLLGRIEQFGKTDGDQPPSPTEEY